MSTQLRVPIAFTRKTKSENHRRTPPSRRTAGRHHYYTFMTHSSPIAVVSTQNRLHRNSQSKAFSHEIFMARGDSERRKLVGDLRIENEGTAKENRRRGLLHTYTYDQHKYKHKHSPHRTLTGTAHQAASPSCSPCSTIIPPSPSSSAPTSTNLSLSPLSLPTALATSRSLSTASNSAAAAGEVGTGESAEARSEERYRPCLLMYLMTTPIRLFVRSRRLARERGRERAGEREKEKGGETTDQGSNIPRSSPCGGTCALWWN